MNQKPSFQDLRAQASYNNRVNPKTRIYLALEDALNEVTKEQPKYCERDVSCAQGCCYRKKKHEGSCVKIEDED